jgi:transcription initiation factor TFIID subunit 5
LFSFTNCKKYLFSFQETEELFRKEANLIDISIEDAQQSDSDVNSVLSAYKSEGDPALYEKSYGELKKFVEGSLDIYKVIRLLSILYIKIYLFLLFHK